MVDKILLELVSRAKDGKLYYLENDDEMSPEEAADVVVDAWDDIFADYYGWNLRKVIFKDCGVDIEKDE